jgi:hypothetical protein
MKMIFSKLINGPKVTTGQLKEITRWYPIITTVMLTMGLLFLVYDIRLYRFITPLFGCSALMSIKEFPFSLKYKFCLWHRLLLLNLTVISLVAFIKAFDTFCDINSVRTLLLINTASIILAYLSYLLFPKPKNYGRRL